MPFFILELSYLLDNAMKQKLKFNKFFLGALLVLSVSSVIGCSKKDEKPVDPLVSRGRSVYVANCTACHNSDPRQVGSIGPEIAGSSLELIQARVLHQSYPQGYKPKRKTKLMPPLPFLEKDIPAIHAYLDSFK